MSEDLVTAKDAKVTKERPILMNGEMVRAILNGRKTQTRRIIKTRKPWLTQCDWYGKHPGGGWWGHDGIPGDVKPGCERGFACPYGQPGDRLWVRETWCSDGVNVWYRADKHPELDHGWEPSIHMPRWASRILLEIVDVRVERVQEISEADAIQEGIKDHRELNAPFNTMFDGIELGEFQSRWKKLYPLGGDSWESNPWVWVIEFKVIEPVLTPHLSQKELGCAEIATLTPSLSHRCAIGKGELS